MVKKAGGAETAMKLYKWMSLRINSVKTLKKLKDTDVDELKEEIRLKLTAYDLQSFKMKTQQFIKFIESKVR